MKKNAPLKVILRNYYIFIRDFLADVFDDKLGHYASSLSWNTLFSIIPLLAILLFFFTTLPMFDSVHQNIEQLIFSNLMPANSAEVMNYINTFMENSNKLGVVGAFYVIFATILFFKNYDYIVNDIFSTPNRNIFSTFKIYILLIIIILFIMGASFYLFTVIQNYLDKGEITSTIQLFYFLPYLMAWMVFYILYRYSANTHVTFFAAMISSFIASLIWHLSKNAFIFYVMYNKTYSNIYGSISTLLFFLLWIYISWAIFIHGLKFCDLMNKDEEIDHI